MLGVAIYLQHTTTYGSLISGSEFIRDLVRRGTATLVFLTRGMDEGNLILSGNLYQRKRIGHE